MSKIQKTRGVFLHSEARWSKAYLVLTRTARDLLRLFLEKRQIVGGKVINNGHIEMRHDWVVEKLGKSKKAVGDAFKQVIGVGFIKIRKKGEGREPHKYTILISNNPNEDEEARWRNYPDKTYFPPKSKTEVGKETRFKKGERANDTLQKYTTNVENGGFVV